MVAAPFIFPPVFPRPPFLTLHRWLALALAPLLFLQALTGTALLFRAELGRLAVPAPTARAEVQGAAALSALVAAASSSMPGARVTRVFLPDSPHDAAFVQLALTGGAVRYAAVDPADGRVLAAGPIWRFPGELALQWHYRLLDGRTGMVIILLCAISLMLLSLTGMLHWWPGRGRLRKGLAIRSAAPLRARLRQWHRSIGVVLTPVMLFSAVTGALLILPDLTAPAAPAAALLPPPAAGDIDRAITSAMAEFPGARVRDVRLAAADRMDVNFRAPRYNSQAIDLASVRLSDGALVRRMAAEDNPAPWITWLPLHSGTAMGVPGLLVLLTEGIVLMILTITGPLMWWQARRPKRRKM